MKRRGIMFALCWFTLSLSPLVSQSDENLRIRGVLVSIGQKYFEQYCSSCHGTDGRGKGPVAEALRTPPADLTRIAQHRGGTFPEAEVAMYIDGRIDVKAHGSRDMPVWGQRFAEKFGGGTIGGEFARGHLVILVEYLKSIQR